MVRGSKLLDEIIISIAMAVHPWAAIFVSIRKFPSKIFRSSEYYAYLCSTKSPSGGKYRGPPAHKKVGLFF